MTKWKFEHSIYTQAKRQLAWRYWTDMHNHAKLESSVEKIELDGRFKSETLGRTITKEYTQEWRLENVVKESQFVIIGKTSDNKGYLSFTWIFEDENQGTRLQQIIEAEGPQVEEYRYVFLEMEKGAVAGMDRLREELDCLSHVK